MKNKNTKQTKQSNPGRPAYKLVFPQHARQFTIGDLFNANGVDYETGKGKKCSAQTVRAAVKKLIEVGALERIEDKLAAPHGDHKGRKQFVFRRVSTAPKHSNKEKIVTAVEIKPLNIQTTADYEAIKNELGIAAPAPAESEHAPMEEATMPENPVAA